MPVYNPLDIHLFTLVTITLLEFTEMMDVDLSNSAWDGLGKIHRALEQNAERAHSDNRERGSGTEQDLDGIPALHWADGLLHMVDSKPRLSGSTETDNGTASGADVAPAANSEKASEENGPPVTATPQPELQNLSTVGANRDQGDVVSDIKNGRAQMVDFSLLTRYGYLNVLAEKNGV